jgi:hypothetical protein
VPASRLRKGYVWNWYRGAGRKHTLTSGIENCAELFGMPRWPVREFLVERTKSVLFAPWGGDRWFSAFAQSARMWGMIEEYRRQRSQATAP